MTYGNGFTNGYGGGSRDWTGVGISPKFDFIIIHESGHEWFGNAVSAADVSDMWIHEGWGDVSGVPLRRIHLRLRRCPEIHNGYKSQVQNRTPIITPARHPPHAAAGPVLQGRALPQHASQRLNDDAKWWKLIHDIFQHVQVQEHHDRGRRAVLQPADGENLTPIFDQYLRHAALPTLELTFDEADSTVSYRWKADEKGFAMPDPRRHERRLADHPPDDRVEAM